MAEPSLSNMLPFCALLATLKANGFRFGVDTHVRLGEYWQLVAKDWKLSHAEIRAHLSAMLCRSAEEQERFGRIFDIYAPAELKPLELDKVATGDGHSEKPAEKPVETSTAVPPNEWVPLPQGTLPTLPPTHTKRIAEIGEVMPHLTFPEEPFRIWNLRAMSESLMLLQEKVMTETAEWDVPGTIQAIMRSGGYPKLVYRRRRQAPRYLVLIEQQNPRDHLAGYAAELVKEINHRDLEAEYYFFDKNPARCWKSLRDTLTHVNLELLKSEWNGARLLLLSHASCFINPETGTPNNLALDLPDHFSKIALLATNSPLEWGAAERSLLSLMPVLPMRTEGLGKLMSAWNGEAQLSFGDWQMKLPEPVPPVLPERVVQGTPLEALMEVYRYLGKDAFRWLCASAVYPEIYFELTSILHDEAIPPLADLSEWDQHEKWNQAMRLLSRLHWLRRGYLPHAIRDDLKRNLKPADLALVEGEIRRILEISKNKVDKSSFAESIRQQMFDWMADQGFRVLWVDDNPENNQQLIDSWSKSLGILFRQATSTADADDMLENERFHLVISDIGRKDEEKPADATLGMASRQSPAPPVVFFTDKRGMNLRGKLMEAGAHEVTDSTGRLQEVVTDLWQQKFRRGKVPPPPNQTAQDQEMLKKLDFFDGEIDGIPSERWRTAIADFQRYIGLVADGIMGPQTREAMKKEVERLEAQQQQQQQAQEQTAGSMPPSESSYQQNVEEPPPLNQTAQDQEMLKKLGYYEGDINGKTDKYLRRAISDFQRSQGLMADGILGTQTREALGKALEESQQFPLMGTAQVQEMLKKLGLYQGEINGKADKYLQRAISDFQKSQGLKADGILGPQTREVLSEVVAQLDHQPTVSEAMRSKAVSVCRILSNGKMGNGFSVGNGYVFTSKAILPNADSLKNAKAYFFDFNSNNLIEATFNTSEYIAGELEDDFVRVQIVNYKDIMGSSLFAPRLSSTKLGTGDRVSIIYYPPNGDLVPQYLLLADIVEFSNDSFTYKATTPFNVNGAPVFNAIGEVIGVTLRDMGSVKRGKLIGGAINLTTDIYDFTKNLVEKGEIKKAIRELTLLYPNNYETTSHIKMLNSLEALQKVDFSGIDGGDLGLEDKMKLLSNSIIKSLDYLIPKNQS